MHKPLDNARLGDLHVADRTLTPITEGTFVIGVSSPKVFLVTGSARRWIPDPETLMALTSAGWGAVRQVSDEEMAALQEGAPMPSRRDGSIYQGATAPQVYVLESGARRQVPDAETLDARFGGLAAVVLIDQSDCDAVPLGSPLPSVNDPVDEAHAIDAFVRSIPHMPLPNAGVTRRTRKTEPVAINGVDYTATIDEVKKTRLLDSLSVASPVADVLYPGALVQGRSVMSGRIAPIPLKRTAGTITVATDLASASRRSASREVGEVSLAAIQDARTELLRDLNPSDSATAIQYVSTQARTLEHGLLNLGVDYKSASFDANLKMGLDAGLKTNTAIVNFQEIFYTVVFTPPATATPFFDPSVRLSDVKGYAEVSNAYGEPNPPAYISQVDYGRSLTVIITGSESWTKLTAALTAKMKAGSVAIDGSYEKTISESQVRVLASGGQSAVTIKLLDDPLKQLPAYLAAGGTYTQNNPGQPLRYSVRYADTRDVFTVALSATFDETADVTGASAQTDLEIWDGPGGGPKPTGIRVTQGDKLAINASGENWSGVWLTGNYGPDGWVSWDKPGDGGRGYPLPNNHPFALCGTYDSGATDNGRWFYIGSGINTVAQDTGELWLATNDPDGTNGGQDKRFQVHVMVTRQTKDELGLSGVGRSE
jgi:Thiol-activated cytolysin